MIGMITAAIIVVVITRRGPVHTGPLHSIYKNTYSDPQDFEEGIFAAQKTIKPVSQKIRAVIIPHHLVASTSIASGIEMLKGQSFKKIVMISPDHFYQCQKTLCTTNATYQTCLLYTSPSPRDGLLSRMPSSA